MIKVIIFKEKNNGVVINRLMPACIKRYWILTVHGYGFK